MLVRGFIFITAGLLWGFIPSIHLQAQNLVRNPDFDQFFTYTDSNRNLVYHPAFWNYTNTKNHPIYFCTGRYKNKTLAWNPHPDSISIQQGENCNYISILILPSTQKAYTTLASPLLRGIKYRLTMDVRANDQSNYASDLLVGFLKHNAGRQDSCVQLVQLVLPDSSCNDQIFDHWTNLAAEFTASGEEEIVEVAGGATADYQRIISSNPDKYLLKKFQGPPLLKYYIDNLVLLPLDSNSTNHVLVRLDSLYSGKSLILENIYFDFDKSELLPASFPALDSLASYLTAHPAMNIRVTGHTDSIGSEEYNVILSLKRAESVTSYLINKGISHDRVIAEGVGAAFPLNPNRTVVGRKRNRRIEIANLQK
ncbi:MAG: OmpA family protein [Bacteroidales bacterium]